MIVGYSYCFSWSHGMKRSSTISLSKSSSDEISEANFSLPLFIACHLQHLSLALENTLLIAAFMALSWSIIMFSGSS
uniref:Uncharacterized protein n=1 Tax=Arundo donax TaxID=35708 RepID=A0A0A8YLU2_ARUDO